jgi:hypothetical protein
LFAIHCTKEVILNGVVISYCIDKECCCNHSSEHITNWRLLHAIPETLVSHAIPETLVSHAIPETLVSHAIPETLVLHANTPTDNIEIIIEDGTNKETQNCNSKLTIKELKDLYGIPSNSHVFGPDSKIPLSGKKTLCELNLISGTCIRIKRH